MNALQNVDGSENAQGASTSPLTIVTNQNTSVTVDLNITIDHLEMTDPSHTPLTGGTMQPNDTAFER